MMMGVRYVLFRFFYAIGYASMRATNSICLWLMPESVKAKALEELRNMRGDDR